MGTADNSPGGCGCSFCKLDTESQGLVFGFGVIGSVLLRVNLRLFSATAATIHCCLDTRRRHKKESVILVLPGAGEEPSL